MNFQAASLPPSISNVKMEAPPLGKYFWYSSWSGWSGRLGVVYLGNMGIVQEIFHNLLGVFYVAIYAQGKRFSALQKDPCIEGEMQGPSSRSRIARM